MVNSNPETVSTDFDTSNRLYFEALDEESLKDILENESQNGEDGHPLNDAPSIVQFGGQTAINLADPLARSGMPIMGTSAANIDLSENRRVFEEVLSQMGIPQPPAFTQQIERHQDEHEHRQHRKAAQEAQLRHVEGDVARREKVHVL
jgi:carbamoyl-phosphate synthase large subunit